MPHDLTRRHAIESLGLLALTSATAGTGAAGRGDGDAHGHGPNEPTLNRFATTRTGAEFTGIYLTDSGQLFFNVQHPDVDPDAAEPGIVGVVAGANLNALPDDFESVQPPEGAATDVRTARGRYQHLAAGGQETASGRQLGVPYTADGEPMTDGANPDFNGFVPATPRGDEGFLFTNWETQPGMVSRLHITRSGGGWDVLDARNLDFQPVEGTWNNCFGTVTPWNTPLTSEEYEPDAHAWFSSEDQTYGNAEAAFEAYLGHVGNAYRYGYVVEIPDPATDDPTPTKHYAMGRFSHENAVVMPDRQTVYMSDDGTGTVFFKFEADEPGDLSAGTLSAAKATQTRGTDAADVAFTLDWLELGHATDDEVEAWITDYDGQEPATNPEYVTDAEIEAWANGNAKDDRAAFLESRKAVAAIGATNEFRKMEGVNVRANAGPGDFLYMAMAEVNETMTDDTGDLRVSENDYGAVYRMRLDGDYDVHRMEPILVGGPDANVCGGCPYDADPNSKSTVCQDCAFNPTDDAETETQTADARGVQRATEAAKTLTKKGARALTDASTTVDPENAVANPDNLVVMPDGRVIVGEDSDYHRPNMLWVYDPGRGNRTAR